MALFNVKAQKVSALFNYALFKDKNDKTYIETYLSVNGSTIRFEKNAKGKYQGEVGFTLMFKNPNSDDIKAFQKLSVKSPEINNLSEQEMQFVTTERQYLSPGEYDMEILIRDLHNANSQIVKANHKFIVPAFKDQVCFSGIQTVEGFLPVKEESKMNKRGKYMPPRLSMFYSDKDSLMNIYCELYNTKKLLGKNQDLILRGYFSSASGQTLSNSGGFSEKIKSDDILIIAKRLSLEKLGTGTYYLNLEIRDRENKLLATQTRRFKHFRSIKKDDLILSDLSQEKNLLDKITKAQILEYVKCLSPLVDKHQLHYVQKESQNKPKKELFNYFCAFWENKAPENPSLAWQQYYEKVLIADKLFGMQNLRGYETSRGQIYLKYGKPSQRMTSHGDFMAKPYEIWNYEVSNRGYQAKFIFLSENSLSQYQLIHSNVPGEIRDPEWPVRIYSKIKDISKTVDQYGNIADEMLRAARLGDPNFTKYKALTYYNNPR
ncbi:MAG: GWxTD domain-containing protein [Bacteroidales bacterium]